jgi:2-polyprenyl-6-hydroxyphenyl methylase/3-demethylubiquinone-9 3-methyltransferase
MWQAIENASRCVKPGGTFAIAIYNDQGALSKRWLKIKKVYNKLPRPLKLPYTLLVMGLRELPPLFWLTLKLKPFSYFDRYREDTGLRGMNYWHDLVDWVGGYPFEVAKPEEMFEFFKGRGFQLQTMVTMAGGVGCNEYVFTKVGDEPAVR